MVGVKLLLEKRLGVVLKEQVLLRLVGMLVLQPLQILLRLELCVPKSVREQIVWLLELMLVILRKVEVVLLLGQMLPQLRKVEVQSQ